jgi:hypothetical protein
MPVAASQRPRGCQASGDDPRRPPLRRQGAHPTIMQVGPIRIDPPRHTVTIGGREVSSDRALSTSRHESFHSRLA